MWYSVPDTRRRGKPTRTMRHVVEDRDAVPHTTRDSIDHAAAQITQESAHEWNVCHVQLWSIYIFLIPDRGFTASMNVSPFLQTYLEIIYYNSNFFVLAFFICIDFYFSLRCRAEIAYRCEVILSSSEEKIVGSSNTREQRNDFFSFF